MTQEEKKVIREKKIADKISAKEIKAIEKQELKAWQKMETRQRERGAWVE